MCAFVKSQEFKDLNIGFSLDEGIPGTSEVVPVNHGEKTRWGN